MPRNRVHGRRRPVWSLAAALVVSAGAVTRTAQADTVGPVELGTLPGDDSLVLAIYDDGVMVGVSYKGRDPQLEHPVRWDADGRISALQTPDSSEGQARDVNRYGGSAGTVTTPTNAVPTRWDAEGRATTMQLPPAFAAAISDTDVVIGT